MYDIVAIVMEIFTVTLLSNLLYVNKIGSSRYLIIGFFSICYAVLDQYVTNISPFCHYLVYTVLVLGIHRGEPIWVAPLAALLAYAMLIYLQVICLRWFSSAWLASHYELAGLVVNLIVLSLAVLLRLLLTTMDINVQYSHLKPWQVATVSCIAAGVILFCYVYKPILEEQYYIDSYVWLCFVGGILFLILLVERQSSRMKNKEIIRRLQKQLDKEAGYRHDYEKQLKVLDREGALYAAEIMKENQLEVNLDRLPEFPRKVMERYLIECKQKGIELKLAVPEPVVKWRMNLKDTISVLGNLLENAVEAVSTLPEPDKWVEMVFQYVSKSQDLQFVIRNPFMGEEKQTNLIMNKGISTKGEGRGYGLYIVGKKIRRCQGEVRIYSKHHVFTVMVDIPNT